MPKIYLFTQHYLYFIFIIFLLLFLYCLVNKHIVQIQQINSIMHKNRTKLKRQSQKQQSINQINKKKPTNQFKTLYQITRQKRAQNKLMEFKQPQPSTERNLFIQKQKTQRSKCISDSLDKIDIINEQQDQFRNIQKTQYIKKKLSHNRSQSCPFMNPNINPINTPFKVEVRCQKNPTNLNKFMMQNQSKRTLKKSSTLHRKNKRIMDKKYSIGHSQLSQQSNTVIVHSLPIQHLSSMLYSLNSDKQRGFKKLGASSRSPQHVLSRYTDLYFQTRLQQQIKMYDLNHQLTKLQKQTQNIKIKQQILQKLASKFDKSDTYNQSQQSLLIH